MKILVCLKQVPQKDAALKLNDAGTWIREDVAYELNEPDAYALEEALRQKQQHGGEVAVVTAGPARAQQVLREALAKGPIARSISKMTGLSPSTPPMSREPSLLRSRQSPSISSSPACNRTILALPRRACSWRKCWDGRMRRLLSKSKRRIQACA